MGEKEPKELFKNFVPGALSRVKIANTGWPGQAYFFRFFCCCVSFCSWTRCCSFSAVSSRC